jgi:hypothetical protein
MAGTRIVRVVNGAAVTIDTRTLAEARAEKTAEIEAAVQARIDAAHASLGWDREGGTLRALRLIDAKTDGPLSAEMQALDSAVQWLNGQIDAAQAARAAALAAVTTAGTNAAVDAVAL